MFYRRGSFHVVLPSLATTLVLEKKVILRVLHARAFLHNQDLLLTAGRQEICKRRLWHDATPMAAAKPTTLRGLIEIKARVRVSHSYRVRRVGKIDEALE